MKIMVILLDMANPHMKFKDSMSNGVRKIASVAHKEMDRPLDSP